VKFLVDVGVGKGVEIWLKETGYDVLSMREINCRAQDIEILHLAVEDQRMIVTMDKDFKA
jgi:predicted nuclease of predicted toxin-antitoxin system